MQSDKIAQKSYLYIKKGIWNVSLRNLKVNFCVDKGCTCLPHHGNGKIH